MSKQSKTRELYQAIENYRNFSLAATGVVDGAVRFVGLHRLLGPVYKLAKAGSIANVALATIALTILED